MKQQQQRVEQQQKREDNKIQQNDSKIVEAVGNKSITEM